MEYHAGSVPEESCGSSCLITLLAYNDFVTSGLLRLSSHLLGCVIIVVILDLFPFGV